MLLTLCSARCRQATANRPHLVPPSTAVQCEEAHIAHTFACCYCWQATAEIAGSTPFVPHLQSDVKKRIESLIDREYLQRVDTGYEYLA